MKASKISRNKRTIKRKEEKGLKKEKDKEYVEVREKQKLRKRDLQKDWEEKYGEKGHKKRIETD